MLHIIWTIITGAIVGVIAKWIHPGPNEPSGFVMTAILGIVGAFAGTYLGQLIGWYGPNDTAGLDHVDHQRHHRTGCVEPDRSEAWSMIPRRPRSAIESYAAGR